MKFVNKALIFGAVVLLMYGVYYAYQLKTARQRLFEKFEVSTTEDSNYGQPDAISSGVPEQELSNLTVVARGLDTPWAIAFLPDGSMLVTERKGTIRLIAKNGGLQAEPVATIGAVKEIGEGGLQGIAFHPDFATNKFVYVYYTYSGGESGTLNRVSKFVFDGVSFSNETVVVDSIPGASNHDGGRIKFGPDKKLYITTGDAQDPSLAQDINSLAGKILRVNDDGSPANGNQFSNRVYSYGHRNPQGITWDSNGQLWATEHGPSGIWPNCCQDEFNKIENGKNYGWPDSVGNKALDGTVEPILHSGSAIWAPGDLAYTNGKFYFVGLRGNALYELDSIGNNFKTHFKGEFGRLREIIVGPDNMLYVTTSNLDGRGSSKPGDDKVIKINPSLL